MNFITRHLDKLGIAGGLFAGLCCLGLPALLSIVSALGLGFLLQEKYLIPFVIVFLLIAVFGLWMGYRSHKRLSPIIIGTISAITFVVFLFFFYNSILIYTAIAGLIVSTVLNTARFSFGK